MRSDSIRENITYVLIISPIIWISFLIHMCFLLFLLSIFPLSLPLSVHSSIHIHTPLQELLWLKISQCVLLPREMGLITFHYVPLVKTAPSSSAFPIFFFFLCFTYHLSFHVRALPLMFVFLFRDLIHKTKRPLFLNTFDEFQSGLIRRGLFP